MNTPRRKTANDTAAEYLWKKRFGYDLKPYKRYLHLLNDYKGWSETNWDTVKYQYYKEYPEYKIGVLESKKGYETLRFFYDNPTILYAILHLNYYGTTLYETEPWYMDCGKTATGQKQSEIWSMGDKTPFGSVDRAIWKMILCRYIGEYAKNFSYISR